MHALWMVVGTFFFASMAVCVKLASAYFNAAELVFYRGLIGVLFMWILASRQKVGLGTQYPGMHAWRSLVGVFSLGAWFYAIGAMPVATATTLNYMSSIWVAVFILASSLLTWRPSAAAPRPPLHMGLVLAIVVGFGGVVLMLGPTFDAHQNAFAVVLGLLSGVAAALAYMQVAVLSRLGEPETRVVFYFSLGAVLAGGVAMGFMGASSLWNAQALWLLPIGIAAALGQLCMTHAYSKASSGGNILVVASLQYFGIVFAALYGVLLTDDALAWTGWAGMALIIASGVTATILRLRATRRA